MTNVVGRTLCVSAFALSLVASSNAVRAGWVDEVWSDESVAEHGSPSITVGAGGDLSVVLPKAVLESAERMGETPESAVRAFLQRYAPQICTRLMNFNERHENLRVGLRLTAPLLRSVPVFVVSPEERQLVIDFVPENQVHCISPSENASS